MLATLPPAGADDFDLCVVGSGPVGLSLALEAARSGLRVLVLEAGPAVSSGAMPETPAEGADLAHPARHAAMAVATQAGLGGTSRLWGGRCVPLEPIDFERRSFVPGSGWPIPYAEVSRWQHRAAEYLQCGLGFQGGDLAWTDLDPILVHQQERWSRRPALADSLGARVIDHPAITLACRATVVDVLLGRDRSSVAGLQVRVDGRLTVVSARYIVLAGGGLKTTRLLLNVQRRIPEHFGGRPGPLGRGYAGHLTGSIADVALTDPADFEHLRLRVDDGGYHIRRRFTLSAEAQRGHELLNTAFYLSNPPFHDHRHRSGPLSALFLAMRVPVLGKRLALAETRQRNRGSGWRALRQHAHNIARQPVVTVGEVVRVARRRLFDQNRMSVFVVPNPTGVYALRYHAEQTCRDENRVTLSDRVASDGLLGVDVVFDYSAQDIDSVVRAHALLDERLRASGRGRLVYHVPEEYRRAAVASQASDGFHQIGTTRMSDDPEAGVVDRDGRVHGLSNLYIASSSVFPTAGEANPTFPAVCLAVRLAHHLAAQAQTATEYR